MGKNNIAQLVENYLLNLLAGARGEYLEFRRLDVANELGCAPSQVTYVLGTRFSESKGYYVESRRGSGGFVRIYHTQPASKVGLAQKMSIKYPLLPEEIENLPHTLWQAGMVTKKELEIIGYMFEIIQKWVPVPERDKKITRILQLTLHNK